MSLRENHSNRSLFITSTIIKVIVAFTGLADPISWQVRLTYLDRWIAIISIRVEVGLRDVHSFVILGLPHPTLPHLLKPMPCTREAFPTHSDQQGPIVDTIGWDATLAKLWVKGSIKGVS